ncbi:MAG: NUDIX domain-containing protein [Candidatus Woesearchaeota archaeon]|nr:NUDIX domain-containing protein [Candidatus Woesearchaeota archaeon]
MENQRPRITAAVLVEKDGKFLLAERNKENYNGYWVIPGGGVKFGETIQDAAVRELKEETNIEADIIKQICYKEIINVPGNYHSVVFYYLAKPKNTEIKPKGDVSQAKFFSIEEIKKLKIAESVELVLKEAGFWK